MMYKVLITGKLADVGVDRLTAEEDIHVDYLPDLPMAEILASIGDYHGLVTRSETPVQKELIDRAGKLKVIARAAVGIANIDVAYATDKGILVMNTPGKNTNSAAELAMGLLLAAVRKITPAHARMKSGGWDRHEFAGMELMGKTLGIMGLGNVGHRMARFGRGFDMRVIAYDPYISESTFERHRVEQVDLDTLLAESDVISIHTPKNHETNGMLDEAELARTKPGVVIVNAARGGIVTEKALKAALDSGHVAAAGIDTWETEPPLENLFKDYENVVMSPHIGASTAEAQVRIAETIADQVPKALRGGIVDAPVNMPQIRMLEGDLMTAYTVLAEKLGQFAAQYITRDVNKVQIAYRGDIAKHDCRLLRLAFLKGYLGYSHDYISYVNAEQRAATLGLNVTDVEDPGFTDYESALKFTLSGSGEESTFGGVVFSGPHPRITLVDGFNYEEEPSGRFLVVVCRPRMGIVQNIARLLDDQHIIIQNFSFAYQKKLKRNMFMIRVAKDVDDNTLAAFEAHDDITFVRRILL